MRLHKNLHKLGLPACTHCGTQAEYDVFFEKYKFSLDAVSLI